METTFNSKLNTMDSAVSSELKYQAIVWLSKQREKFYQGLMLKEQSEFCESKHLSSALYSLSSLTHLYIKSCNLTSIPIPSGYLQSLQHLDVSSNGITEISYDPPQTLKTLYIDGNPIEPIHIKNLSKYEGKFIRAGSEYTRSIEITVLEFIAKGKLSIDITVDHRKNLVLPPYEVLDSTYETLGNYVEEIKLEKKSVTPRVVSQNVVLFLGARGVKSDLKTALTRNKETANRSPPVHAKKENHVGRSAISFPQEGSVSILDFRDINSYEYSLDFLRGQNKICVVVVDLSVYNDRNHADLVTKWLRGFILDSNCKFLILPTAASQVSDLERERKVAMMQKLIEEWRNGEIEFIEETRDFLLNTDKDMTQNMKVTIQNSLDLFRKLKIEVLPTRVSDGYDISRVKESIRNMLESQQACLPFKWRRVLDFVEDYKDDDTYYVSFLDLVNRVADHWRQLLSSSSSWGSPSVDITKVQAGVKQCLRYLGRKGRVIWHEEKRDYVFNNIEKVLEVYGELFRGDIDDLVRQSYHIDERIFSRGLLSKDFFRQLALPFRVKEHELDRIIELLHLRGHCFEDNPLELQARGGCFLKFPFFYKALDEEYFKESWPQRVPHGHLQFSYVFQCQDKFPLNVLGAVSFGLQNYFKLQTECYRADWANGVYVQADKIKILVQRRISQEQQHEELVVSLRTHREDFFEFLDLNLIIYNDIVSKVMNSISVTNYKRLYVCPHCILTERPLSGEAYTLPLETVMRSRDGSSTNRRNDYFETCPNADVTNATESTVPAIFFQPLILGKKQCFKFCLFNFCGQNETSSKRVKEGQRID